MKSIKTVSIIGICIASFGAPVFAEGKNEPNVRREVLEYNRTMQQELNGPSGWGQKVAERAQQDGGPFRNLGDFLKQCASGEVRCQ